MAARKGCRRRAARVFFVDFVFAVDFPFFFFWPDSAGVCASEGAMAAAARFRSPEG
jgi:hypothetical protein